MTAVEKEIKCEKCDSTKVNVNRHKNGSIDNVVCLDCGHREPYFSATPKAREVLKILLGDKKT